MPIFFYLPFIIASSMFTVAAESFRPPEKNRDKKHPSEQPEH